MKFDLEWGDWFVSSRARKTYVKQGCDAVRWASSPVSQNALETRYILAIYIRQAVRLIEWNYWTFLNPPCPEWIFLGKTISYEKICSNNINKRKQVSSISSIANQKIKLIKFFFVNLIKTIDRNINNWAVFDDHTRDWQV